MATLNMEVEETASLHEEVDLEAGLGSSRRQLLHPFEEERPEAIVASVKSSVRSSVRKAKYYCSFVWNPIKNLLAKLQIFIIIALYSFFGAWLFQTIEAPVDLANKEDAYHTRLIARESMILNLRSIYEDNREDREDRWKKTVLQFEQDIGLEEPVIETVWTFWMAFLYAGTLTTTIGYGNIACQTTSGQVATLLYGFVGIPIMLVLLTELGDYLLVKLKSISSNTTDFCIFVGVKCGFLSLEQGSQRLLRYAAFRKKLSKGILGNIFKSSVNDLDVELQNVEEGELEPDPPVISAIIVTFGFILLSAAVFCMWEDWDYWTSVYFFFISSSTIGLGDVVPAHPEYMIFAFLVVLIGLALVTVCVTVVQEKIAIMYMKFLQKILDDYMKAAESGDPNAAKQMMDAFQGNAKFLMPFVSKNQGTKVMTQFKEDCAAKGIEPPPVLTSIDPSTGMPAFASAPKEDFSDYIQHAEEKHAEEQKKEQEFKQRRLETPIIPKPVMFTVEVQTSVPQPILLKHSFGAQFCSSSSDEECQTSEAESSDEGIQVWPSLEDVSVQHETEFSDFECQYETPLPSTTMSGVAPIFKLVSTGVQPEVSNFIFDDVEDLTSEFSSESEDEDEYLSDDEASELHEESLDRAKIALSPSVRALHKSVSEESQATIIHVSPSDSPQSDRKSYEKKKLAEERKKELKRQKEEAKKEAKQQARGLRFMKNRGDQTCPETIEALLQTEVATMSTECQWETTTCEQTTQFEIQTKGRRCQTKLTCMSESQLSQVITTQRRRPIRRSSTLSSKTSSKASEQLYSSSSIEGVGGPSGSRPSPRPQLQSIDESEAASSPLPSEEVELNICVVARPVDEHGDVVDEGEPGMPYSEAPDEVTGYDDVTGMEFDEDDVFGSDIEIDEDDLEHFAADSYTQTDYHTYDDLQTQASAMELDLLSSAYCQTELSAMYKEKEAGQTETEAKTVEETDATRFLVGAGVQTVHSAFYVQRQEADEEKRRKKEKKELKQRDSSGTGDVDTDSAFQQSTEEKPTSSTGVGESSSEESEDEMLDENLVYLIDGSTQYTLDCEDADVQASTSVTNNACGTELLYTMTAMQVTTEHESNQSQTSPGLRETYESSEIAQTEFEVRLIPDSKDVACSPSPIMSADAASSTDLLQTSSVVQIILPTEDASCSATVETQESDVQAQPSTSSSESQTAATSSEETKAVIQTDAVVEETSMQTEISLTSTAIYALPENSDESTQAEAWALPQWTQTDIVETGHQLTQTDPKKPEKSIVQTEPESYEHEVQAVPDVTESGNQTESETTTSGSQTIVIELEDTETQAGVEVTDAESQDILEIATTSTQTIVDLQMAESQTEQELTKTAVEPIEQSISQTDASMTAMPSLSSTQIQSDVSMFVVDPKERKSLENTHNVRFNVDSGTWMEAIRMREAVTQSDYKSDSTAMQATPLIVTSSTQHISPGTSDEVTQTEIHMKNKKSQGMSVTQPISQSAVETTPEGSEEESGAIVSTSVLWSDFDHMLVPEDEASQYSATPPPSENNEAVEVTNNKNVKLAEADVQAKPETEDSSAQAVVESKDAGAGFDENEDWVKVYVAELDEERKSRMFDIGIQTGVLARVQHIYGKKEAPGEGEAVSLRKTESTEQLTMRTVRVEGSDESLSMSVKSAAESIDEREAGPSGSSTPGGSRRAPSFHKPRKTVSHADKEGLALRDTTVADLRSRFEKKHKEKRPRSTSTER